MFLAAKSPEERILYVLSPYSFRIKEPFPPSLAVGTCDDGCFGGSTR